MPPPPQSSPAGAPARKRDEILTDLLVNGLTVSTATGYDSQRFFDTAGSTDKTLKLYDGHYHDLLNDVDKEIVMADIKGWIDARLPLVRSGPAMRNAFA